jgi:hypothetical protein
MRACRSLTSTSVFLASRITSTKLLRVSERISLTRFRLTILLGEGLGRGQDDRFGFQECEAISKFADRELSVTLSEYSSRSQN